MKRESEWLDKAIELYSKGCSYEDIEKEVGVPRKRIGSKINSLIAEGKVQKRERIPRKRTQTKQHIALVNDIKRKISLKEPLADLIPLYKVSDRTINRIVRELEKMGEIEKLPRVRKKPERKNYTKKPAKREAASTLAPGQTIKCTPSVARTCVYGNSMAQNNTQLCRYSLITNKCRSLGPDGCKLCACTKYSRVSKSNPRLEIPEEGPITIKI